MNKTKKKQTSSNKVVMGLVNFYMSNEGQYRVTNYVYENGYTSAVLGMMGASGYGTALGLWSPDTYTNYPVLK